jgi:uncharacterized protein YceK
MRPVLVALIYSLIVAGCGSPVVRQASQVGSAGSPQQVAVASVDSQSWIQR